MTKSIFVTTTFEALHHYPNAPAQVDFLKFIHRHLFHVKLEIQVEGSDRELEFLIVRRWLISILPHGEDLGAMSCEMIAEQILRDCQGKYGTRHVAVTVSEDGENGARVSYP